MRGAGKGTAEQLGSAGSEPPIAAYFRKSAWGGGGCEGRPSSLPKNFCSISTEI